MDLWAEGSRACQGCGATVVDGLRPVHEAFHARVEPGQVAEPAPVEEPTGEAGSTQQPQVPAVPSLFEEADKSTHGTHHDAKTD